MWITLVSLVSALVAPLAVVGAWVWLWRFQSWVLDLFFDLGTWDSDYVALAKGGMMFISLGIIFLRLAYWGDEGK